MSNRTEEIEPKPVVIKAALAALQAQELESRPNVSASVSTVTEKAFTLDSYAAWAVLHYGVCPVVNDVQSGIIIIEAQKTPEEKAALKAEFTRLTEEWKSQRGATSFASEIAMLPAYQRILTMGQDALPWILEELERELDHWFWALGSISGENPVPAESEGKMKEMARIWLEWGRKKGYVR
jgi:hypothetical protein